MKSDNRLPRITFDEGSTAFVLSAFDKSIDKDGFIVDTKTNQRVLTPDGEEIAIDELGGIKKGSEIYIKKDLTSILKLAKKEL